MGTIKPPEVNHPRRPFPSTTVARHTATQFGLSPAARTTSLAIKPRTHAAFPAVKQIDAGVLNVG